MNIKVIKGSSIKIKGACVALWCFEKDVLNPVIKQVDKQLTGIIRQLVKEKVFGGKLNQTTFIYSLGKLNVDKVILIGLGKKKEMTLDKLRQTSATIAKIAEGKGIKKLMTNLPDMKIKGMPAMDIGQTIAEGTILSLYKFNKYIHLVSIYISRNLVKDRRKIYFKYNPCGLYSTIHSLYFLQH